MKLTQLRNRGFSLIEIILAMAIAAIVFISVFQNALAVHLKTSGTQNHEREYFSYSYGEQFCSLGKMRQGGAVQEGQINLQNLISTSTRVTSVHILKDGLRPWMLITTDSASTTEPDIFIMSLDLMAGNASVIHSTDVGPGIQDSKLLDSFLYVANTSVNSHVKSFRLNLTATGSSMIQELSNIQIATLAASVSLPKKLSIVNGSLLLGTEKSNAGPELFELPIDSDGGVRTIRKSLELNGQVNQALPAYGKVYVANAADPELRILHSDLLANAEYDAPLTLGNGKSVLRLGNITVFGRTLGSGELSILAATSTLLDVKKIDGTVDYLQKSDSGDPYGFLAFTANQDKELQFWRIEKMPFSTKLALERTVNVPGRVTAYACDIQTLYAFAFINNQATLTWLSQ